MENNDAFDKDDISQHASINNLNYSDIVHQTLDDMNTLLAPYDLTVSQISKSDETWIFNNLEHLTLLWQNVILNYDNTLIYDPAKKGFEFVFRLCTESGKPAGICFCIYDPGTNTIQIPAFENFTRDELTHPLNGRMFRYILYTVYLYGLALIEHYNVAESTLKIRVCQAINVEVLNHYLKHADLVQLADTMDCETTFTALDSYIATLDSSLGI